MKAIVQNLQLPCGALFRLYFCFYVILFALFGLFEPASLTHKIVAASGSEGFILLHVMIFIALVGLADTIINDILPPQFVFHSALDLRHHTFTMMALCFAVMMWYSVSARSYLSIPFYLLHVCGLVVSAVLDVRERYQFKNTKKEVFHAT